VGSFAWGKLYLVDKPIWDWSRLGILEFVPLKVSGSIVTGANFGGQVHTELALALNGTLASGR